MPKKIIIIGAGIAGLAACRELMTAGFDAVILEAANHPGGRAVSKEMLGITLGCGANWIHGNKNNPIALLANKFQAPMVSIDLKKFMRLDQYGHPISPEVIEKFNKKFELFIKKSKKLAYQAEEDISLAKAFSHFINPENFSSTDLALFKAKLRALEGYIGDSYEFLSARHWDAEEAWPGDNCFLTNSYQPIIQGLSNACPIHFNNVVQKIKLQENNVEVTTENNIYLADAVILTIPLGVLKKNAVTFDPPLPLCKQKAIDNLGMGLFNITAIRFPFSFWPKHIHAMILTQLDNPSISTFFNLHCFIKEPILIGYSGGENARQLESHSDEEVINNVMHHFRKRFGNDLPDPDDYINTRWSLNPLSYGSYSYLKTGSSTSDYDTMAQSVSDRLFFAGEATSSTYPATTHGAYLTGVREADKIKAVFA